MSPRPWKILSAMTALLAATTVVAAQLRELPPLPPQNDPGRVTELLRRLDLPPDKAIVPAMDRAFAKRNDCLRHAARDLVLNSTLRNSQLAAAACQKCEQRVLEADLAFYRAFKYRNLGEEPPQKIKVDQCVLVAFPIALEAPLALAFDQSADKISPKTIISIGGWKITEEINFEGRLIFRAVSVDKKDERRRFEALCWPTEKDSFRAFLFDPAAKKSANQTALTVGHEGSQLDQVAAATDDGFYVVSAVYLRTLEAAARNENLTFLYR